tara:strand:- start:533 stop:2014 length:1482 start_codon:yes stop_codon:yes gene_type:complete
MALGTFSGGASTAHLTPRPDKSLFAGNYLSIDGNDFNFTKQFLPEVYEKEVERFGNRSISGFLRMVGAEMPMASDEVVWAEQGRIHVAFDDCSLAANSDAATNKITFASSANQDYVNIGDTVIISKGGKTTKCYVQAKPSATTITAVPYKADQLMDAAAGGWDNTGATTGISLFVYGSEYGKGSKDVGNSINAKSEFYKNSPVIIRDKYSVNGSDTAQIGWVEVTTEIGTSGYLWYLKSEHEARIRFEDQLEMVMIEAEKAAHSFTADPGAGSNSFTVKGSEGMFAAIESRGLVYSDADFGGSHADDGLADFDKILQELDKQGAIEENMLFLNRGVSLAIDNMLAAQNSYGTGGTSYGVFDNSEDMALNLGFSGFRRGSYDFYKTDWKYLNDSTTRGLVKDVEGVFVPAGVSTVYDQILGKNIQRPFLHVRYRASEADDRRMKSWITGSVGGNYTSDEDAMNVHFLSERCLCVQGANNFILLKSGDGVIGDAD